MIVYRVTQEEGYEVISFLTDDGEDRVCSLGCEQQSDWDPVLVERVTRYGKERYKPSDFPWYVGQLLFMRRKAVDTLRPILEAHGQILPLATSDDVELFVFNMTTVVDALDQKNSTISYLDPEQETIFEIEKPVFRKEALKGVDMFYLPHDGSLVYLTDDFVRAYHGAGLVGLSFVPQWSDDEG